MRSNEMTWRTIYCDGMFGQIDLAVVVDHDGACRVQPLPDVDPTENFSSAHAVDVLRAREMIATLPVSELLVAIGAGQVPAVAISKPSVAPYSPELIYCQAHRLNSSAAEFSDLSNPCPSVGVSRASIRVP